MRARVIATGDIVDVEFSHKSAKGDIYFYKDIKSHKMYHCNNIIFLEEIQHTSEIDWEQRRFELVKAALKGMSVLRIWNDENDLADWTLRIADAVMAKLKER